ncbi:hypothetical protein QBE54_08135 [Thermatribacter velox]|jgi:hypothetical protein|uniref:Magnetosome protein MamS/MamX domain-containing protein n=1 Tax=Thermatribacter velox TaxID=3039681 RepID=A0ABZ2Y968_9BACT
MRKNLFLGMVLTGLLVLGFSALALAQNNWGQNLTGKTELIAGKVLAVDLTPPNTSLRLQVGEEVLTVELGPAWFVDDFSIKADDEVTIVGERTGENVLVAYSVSKSQDGNAVTLTLRDANGKPVWSGTSGPQSGNQYQNRNRVTLQNGGNGNGNGNAPGQGRQSGPQDGSGNQWGQNNRNQSGQQGGNGGRR